MKKCNVCLEDKPLEAFWKDKFGTQGRSSICRECRSRKRYGDNGKLLHSKMDNDALSRFGKKRCSRCHTVKRLNEFSIKSDDNLNSFCRKCNAARRRKATHNLSAAEYQSMLVVQSGICLVCKLPPNPGKRLCVDHDHETGKVRGLLCHNCNVALGLLREDAATILALARYIKACRAQMNEEAA